MKLLRALNMGQSCGRLALLGGIVLWLSGAIASPVYAVSTEYAITGGDLHGTFTIDLAGRPFELWAITSDVLGFTFTETNLFITQNNGGFDIRHVFQQEGNTGLFFNMTVLDTGTYDARARRGTIFSDGSFLGITSEQRGSYTASSGPVPEPAAAVLLAIGLLVLAGSRWLPSRGARQQLG